MCGMASYSSFSVSHWDPSEKANAVDPFEMPGYTNFIAAFQRTLAQFDIPPEKSRGAPDEV